MYRASVLCYLDPCDAACLSREAKLQISRAILLMRRVMRSDGFPETRPRIKLSQWNTVHGDRGQLRPRQPTPLDRVHRRWRTVPPSARRSSAGRDCLPRDPSGLDRGRSRSRRAVANVRWGALNEGGPRGARRTSARNASFQQFVGVYRRGLQGPLHVDFTRLQSRPCMSAICAFQPFPRAPASQ
jgi:hypothetical protein